MSTGTQDVSPMEVTPPTPSSGMSEGASWDETSTLTGAGSLVEDNLVLAKLLNDKNAGDKMIGQTKTSPPFLSTRY